MTLSIRVVYPGCSPYQLPSDHSQDVDRQHAALAHLGILELRGLYKHHLRIYTNHTVHVIRWKVKRV